MNREAVVPMRADWRTQYDDYHVSPAVRVGDQVYCCGITGWDPETGGYSPDAEEQFDRTFRNVAEVLEAAGCGWQDVVKAVSYHVGELHEHIPTFVRVRDRHVREPYPVWTAAVVVALPHPDALVQIEVSAVVGDG